MLDWLFNWLQGAIAWLWGVVKAAFVALLEMLRDTAIWIADGILTALGDMIAAIPVPSFLQSGALQTAFGQLDGSILYFLGVLRVPEGLALIGVAVGFRLLRKAVTLFQW